MIILPDIAWVSWIVCKCRCPKALKHDIMKHNIHLKKFGYVALQLAADFCNRIFLPSSDTCLL